MFLEFERLPSSNLVHVLKLICPGLHYHYKVQTPGLLLLEKRRNKVVEAVGVF